MELTFREGTPDDRTLVYTFLRDLASHEGVLHLFDLTESHLQKIISSTPHMHILIAEEQQTAIGLAIWSECFNPFGGGLNMWLSDLFVKDTHRGKGAGKQIFNQLKIQAKQNGYQRIEWFISNKNEAAKAFYRKMDGFNTTHTERWRVMLSS